MHDTRQMSLYYAIFNRSRRLHWYLDLNRWEKDKRRKDVDTVTRISAQVIPGHGKTSETEQEHFAKTLDHLKTIVVEGKEHVPSRLESPLR